jgi:putative ABC transport system permease protein
VIFGLFLAFGILIERVARRLPRARIAELAIAQASIAAPDGLTRSIVLSLGAGLSLLVAVALVDASLVDELSAKLPKDSPDYFVLDLPRSDVSSFEAIVRAKSPSARIATAPMLRGRIVKLKGIPVEEIKTLGDAQWVLNGDRGLTYADAVPDGSRIIKGSWWADAYAGPPLVSFESELAKRLQLDVGDTVTVNVLGRNVDARVSNLREVKWESLAINFVMVFSPNTLRAAPHNLLATVKLPDADLRDEVAIARELGVRLPSVTTIRVKDAIEAFSGVFAKVMTAVRVAGSVTLVAGALVLAGALATAQRRRVKEAVILKVLGATRWRILTAHAAEYTILAILAALLAIALGSAAAWLALTQLMELAFVPSISAIAGALALSLILVLTFGALGTWQVLRSRPNTYLRSD